MSALRDREEALSGGHHVRCGRLTGRRRGERRRPRGRLGRELLVRGLISSEQLVETLAERIAESCLLDPRVRLARIRVEKLDVFADSAAAGVEIERRQKN